MFARNSHKSACLSHGHHHHANSFKSRILLAHRCPYPRSSSSTSSTSSIQCARLSPRIVENGITIKNAISTYQYHTGLSRIMSTITAPSDEIAFQSKASQIKKYQHLSETLRARRCDTTSGHLIRLKPSGSNTNKICIYIYMCVYRQK